MKPVLYAANVTDAELTGEEGGRQLDGRALEQRVEHDRLAEDRRRFSDGQTVQQKNCRS